MLICTAVQFCNVLIGIYQWLLVHVCPICPVNVLCILFIKLLNQSVAQASVGCCVVADPCPTEIQPAWCSEMTSSECYTVADVCCDECAKHVYYPHSNSTTMSYLERLETDMAHAYRIRKTSSSGLCASDKPTAVP